MEKRVEMNDSNALRQLGIIHSGGRSGLPQNYNKANKLWRRAGKLGNAEAYYNLAGSYLYGRGVVIDEEKARYYYEIAAIGGSVLSRHNLGYFESEAGNMKTATKHFMIAAGAGYDLSLKAIRQGFMNGHVTKDDFEKALRAHKAANDEMKSGQREEAAAVLASFGAGQWR